MMYIITKTATLKNITKTLYLAAINLIFLSYAQKASAFTVELFKSSTSTPINSLEKADALIQGNNLEFTASGSYEDVNFSNAGYGQPWGNFDSDNSFPGITLNSNIDKFAVRITSELTVNTAGYWTFLTNSDDGVRLRIDGENVIVDDSLHPTADRWGTTILSAGSHNLELVYFENKGVASLELSAAQGNYPEYDPTTNYTPYNSSDFQLVGDTLNGAVTVPFEFSPSIGIFLCFGLFGCERLYKKLKLNK